MNKRRFSARINEWLHKKEVFGGYEIIIGAVAVGLLIGWLLS